MYPDPGRYPSRLVQGCAGGELVKVYRVKKGKDPVVSRDRTTRGGRYVALERYADGRFYAKVTRSAAGIDTCLGTRSKTISAG